MASLGWEPSCLAPEIIFSSLHRDFTYFYFSIFFPPFYLLSLPPHTPSLSTSTHPGSPWESELLLSGILNNMTASGTSNLMCQKSELLSTKHSSSFSVFHLSWCHCHLPSHECMHPSRFFSKHITTVLVQALVSLSLFLSLPLLMWENTHDMKSIIFTIFKHQWYQIHSYCYTAITTIQFQNSFILQNWSFILIKKQLSFPFFSPTVPGKDHSTLSVWIWPH